MLAKKPSSPRLAMTPEPDLDTFSHSAPPNRVSRSTPNARMRLVWLEDVLATADKLAPEDAVTIYHELLEIQRSGLVDEATQDACWSILLKQILRARTDPLARALASAPLPDVRAFFDELAIRRPNWRQYVAASMTSQSSPSPPPSSALRHFHRKPPPPPPPSPSPPLEDALVDRTRSLLLAVLSVVRNALDLRAALAFLEPDPALVPLALLFDRPLVPSPAPLNLALFFAFLAHTPSVPPRQSAFALTVTSAIDLLAASPDTNDLVRAVAHILTALQPLATPDPTEHDVRRLRAALPPPAVPPWSPRKYLARHPSAPYLSFAVLLAAASPQAARLLLEGGLVRTLEALYDQDFPDPRVPADEPYVQPRDELYALCLALLRAVATHCDLRDCVLVEELTADVRRCERQLSEHYFGVFWVG